MAVNSRLSALLRAVARSPQARRMGRRVARAAVHEVQKRRGAVPEPERSGRAASSAPEPRGSHGALPDRASHPPVAITYAPAADGDADPGEVVWGWVPFEEDLSQGKDRPVLVLARESGADGEVLVVLMLTSRDRVQGVRTDEHGATWVDIGSGGWDSSGRPSEVRADRLIRLRPDAVRREGARLDQRRFEAVADVVRAVHGWA